MLREERDPASAQPSGARGCRDRSNHWTTGVGAGQRAAARHFSLKEKKLAEVQKAEGGPGTCARGRRPATCGSRPDPGSNYSSFPTLHVPLPLLKLSKGASWWVSAQAPKGNDKGSSVSSPRPPSSTELGIHQSSPTQDSGFSPLPSPRPPGDRQQD